MDSLKKCDKIGKIIEIEDNRWIIIDIEEIA